MYVREARFRDNLRSARRPTLPLQRHRETLAVELNTSTRTLLAPAREMHLPIFDDEDQLTDDDVDRLRTLYSMTGGRMPGHQLTEIIPGFTPALSCESTIRDRRH